jgi:FkbM family methyltransferase
LRKAVRTGRRAALRTAHARLRGVAWGRTVTQALRVDRPHRYALASLRRRRAAAAAVYTVRRSNAAILLRHDTSDPGMFDEIFVANSYEPPPDAAASLAALGPAPRVLDLGANVGLFSAWASGRWPGARVTAVEPDPGNFEILERCAHLNAGRGQWKLVPAAASTSPGVMRFVAGAGSESHEAHADEVGHSSEVPAVDAFEYLAHADLVKMDIEGGEWAVLSDPRLREIPARAIVLEHHGRLCPVFPPRQAAADLLHAAGFQTWPSGAEVNGVGMLWGWR